RVSKRNINATPQSYNGLDIIPIGLGPSQDKKVIEELQPNPHKRFSFEKFSSAVYDRYAVACVLIK
ncbi:hypothetical protein PFISCL1PPCAC_25295, partial [Pristionchus fissidentatus]